jgi:hypothetical protein
VQLSAQSNFNFSPGADVASTPGLTAGRVLSKPCSKCKRVLPVTAFAKWHNKAGLYPSCRECEREHREKRLSENPLCIRCKLNPHAAHDAYCIDCKRILKHRPPRKWVSRRSGLEWCKVCGIRPRLEYHHYCFLCKNEYQNRTRSKKWAERYPLNSQRQIATARAYATGLLARGKIHRGPCVFCGDPGQDFHHYDYLPRTLNFEDVCCECHVAVHKILRLLLTTRIGLV